MSLPSVISSAFSNMTLLPTWWPKKSKNAVPTGVSSSAGTSAISSLPSSVFAPPQESATAAVSTNQIKLKLSRSEKIFFLDTIGSLISAGIPIVKSLQILYFQSKKASIRNLSAHLKIEIEHGRSLANICRDLTLIFTPFDIAMFEMGDATGKIGQMFATLTDKEEKTQELERKIFGALVYPMAIVSVAIIMVIVLLVFVIPRIEWIYADAHTELPGLTLGVIAISHFIKSYGIFVLGFLFVLGVGAKILFRNPRYKIYFDAFVLRVPLFGGLLRSKILVIFSDFLALLLVSGITIHRALEIVGEWMNNLLYQRYLREIIQEIRSGKHLSSAIGWDYLEKKMTGEALGPEDAQGKVRLDAFSIELTTAIKVGEQTGSLALMLSKAARRYDKEIDTVVKSLSSLLEPIVIMVIGAVVGVIVLAIMMPFFNMVNVI